MMPCKYIALDKTIKELDLDSVIDVVLCYSHYRDIWTSTIVYDQHKDILVELRSSPQDYQGNSMEEAEQISEKDLVEHYGISCGQMIDLRKNPKKWKTINMRQ